MFQLSETIVSITNQEIIDDHPRTVHPRPEVVYFSRKIFFYFLPSWRLSTASLSLASSSGVFVSFASPIAAVASPTSMEGVEGLCGDGVGGDGMS
jgi:hypothetical protein